MRQILACIDLKKCYQSRGIRLHSHLYDEKLVGLNTVHDTFIIIWGATISHNGGNATASISTTATTTNTTTTTEYWIVWNL